MPSSAWVVELITATIKRIGIQSETRYLSLTTLPAITETLQRLICQRWSTENESVRHRDTQLGEDAHRYAKRCPERGQTRSPK